MILHFRRSTKAHYVVPRPGQETNEIYQLAELGSTNEYHMVKRGSEKMQWEQGRSFRTVAHAHLRSDVIVGSQYCSTPLVIRWRLHLKRVRAAECKCRVMTTVPVCARRTTVLAFRFIQQRREYVLLSWE